MTEVYPLPVLFALALLGAGCRSKDDPHGGTNSVQNASNATALAQGDASASATLDAGAPREVLLNLLHETDAELTLSSRVDNPRDYPEHLVDGKRETAWNGKTGDTNAWIEVNLDPRVHVASFEITAGFDKGAPFEQNLRIKKVKVERDGVLVREVTLDPAVRGPQHVPVDKPGGRFKITVMETLPGTNPKWQEIVVSELAALGTAPKEVRLAEPKLPRVNVAAGSAPAPKRAAELWELSVDGREGRTVREVCDAWKKELMSVVRREQKAGHGLEGYDEKSVICTEMAAPALEAGALPDGWSIPTAVTLGFFDGVAVKEDRYLMLRRKDGIIVGGPEYSSANDIGDSGRPSGWRAAMMQSKGAAVLVLASVTMEIPMTAWLPDGTPDASVDWMAEHRARVCHVESPRMRCDEPRMTLFVKRTMDAKEKAGRGKGLTAELPTLDPKSGRMQVEDGE